MTDHRRPPWYYWAIAGISALFFVLPTKAMINGLIDPSLSNFSSELHQEFFLANPAWWRVSYIVTTMSLSLGCLLLLIRTTLALPFFFIALAGAVTYFFYEYVLADGIAVFGYDALLEPLYIFSVIAFFIWFTLHSKERGYVRQRRASAEKP